MNHLRLYILAATLLSIFHSVSAQEIEWEYDDVFESCLAGKTDYNIIDIENSFCFILTDISSDGSASLYLSIVTKKGSETATILTNAYSDQKISLFYNAGSGKEKELQWQASVTQEQEQSGYWTYLIRIYIPENKKENIRLLSSHDITRFSLKSEYHKNLWEVKSTEEYNASTVKAHGFKITKPTAAIFARCVDTAISHLPDKSKWAGLKKNSITPVKSYALADLLAKPFGISYCREISSYKERVSELENASGLRFQGNGPIYLVDVDKYPRLFDLSLTKAREQYRENDDRWPGKTVLWYWDYEYVSTSGKTASQAKKLFEDVISSVNKTGGNLKPTQSAGNNFEAMGWLGKRRTEVALRQSSDKYVLTISVIETEGKYSPYNRQ